MAAGASRLLSRRPALAMPSWPRLRNRLIVIDPLHQKFDPHLHQAISVAPSKDVAPNHVVSVLQKGYMINDRILRPALVTVSQPS